MNQLTKDNWDTYHTFRLEWQPGENGYIHWYSDDKFRFGIEAEGLKIQNAIIPNEPSYIILNTAISTSWGFPTPPPGCNLYDCKDINGQCGMNPGFCKSLPADFYIDYVRVYQNKKNDSKQTVGCNPKEYPTKRFINAHAYRYKGGSQATPLLPILNGGGKCHNDQKCGQGKCVSGKCKCPADWTGPTCLVSILLILCLDCVDELFICRSLIIRTISLIGMLIIGLTSNYHIFQQNYIIHSLPLRLH